MKFKGILLFLLLVAVAVGVVLALVYLRPKECDRVVVRLEFAGPDSIVTTDEVLDLLESKGIALAGAASGKLKRSEVEEALRTNVWFDSLLNLTPIGTTLMMDVRIKTPLITVYPNNGLPYFIGTNGELLPDNSRVQSQLFVLNGNVATPYTARKNVRDLKENTLQDAYRIASALAADSLLSSQLTQIYVNEESEIEVYNTLACHSVLFGSADNLEQKMEQLHIVYDNGIIFLEPNKYSQVDVRFKNRVFAQKRKI